MSSNVVPTVSLLLSEVGEGWKESGKGRGEDMFQHHYWALLSWCFLLSTSNSNSADSNNPETADTWLTTAKCSGLTRTLLVHSFPTFSRNTAPLLSLDYVPPCKTEPRLWLVNNFMYHSLQCIVLKDILRLFSWQLKKSFSSSKTCLFHDIRNHCKIVKTDKCRVSNSLWSTLFDPSNCNYVPPLASSLQKTWRHPGLHTSTHHGEWGGKKERKTPGNPTQTFLAARLLWSIQRF